MKKNDENDNTLVAKEESLPAQGTPDALLAMAVNQNLDIDKLKQLMDMKREWEDRLAKKAFFAALASFQFKCPVIEKNKNISFGEGRKTNYNFAPLGEIEKQIKGPMQECGLTKRWEINNSDPAKILVTCIITHVDGHSESCPMDGPKDTSGSKNEIQARASTITYLERYTLLAALGLSTADEDDDGQSTGDKTTSSPASHQEENSSRPTEWLNKGTAEWNDMELRIKKGEVAADVLKEMKSKWRISKGDEAVILAIKFNPSYLPKQEAEANSKPKAEPVKQPATTVTTPKANEITAMDMAEWQAKLAEYNSANTPEAERFVKGKVSEAVRIYNNNVNAVQGKGRKAVSLEAIMGVYQLEPEVVAHYKSLIKVAS